MRKVRGLTFERRYQITRILKEREHSLCEERPAFTDLARRISKEVGYEVSDTSISYICRVIGIKWEPRVSRHNSAIFEELKGKVSHLEAETAYLRGLVHQLYSELGVHPPPGVVLPTETGNNAVVPGSPKRM
jgi:hypothetical protein